MVLHRFESPENTNQNRDRHPCGCEIGGTLSIRQEPVAVLKPPLVPEVGVEQPQFSPVKTASDENGGHPGGHFRPDFHLEEIIARWDSLPEAVRSAVHSLTQQADAVSPSP